MKRDDRKLVFETLEARTMLAVGSCVEQLVANEVGIRSGYASNFSLDNEEISLSANVLEQEEQQYPTTESEFDAEIISLLETSSDDSSDGINCYSDEEAEQELDIITDALSSFAVEQFSEAELASLACNFTSSGGSSSGGGSGGGGASGGGDITVHLSGAYVEYGNTNLISEGEEVLLTFVGGVPGDIITATINHGGTVNDDFVTTNWESGSNGLSCQTILGSSGSGSILVRTRSDRYFDEGDEGFSVSFSVTRAEGPTPTIPSESFVIVERPEFLSDVDVPVTETPEQGDSPTIPSHDAFDNYRAYIREDENNLVWRSEIGVVSSNEYLVYGIVGQYYSDDTHWFQINRRTGEISLREGVDIGNVLQTRISECDSTSSSESVYFFNFSIVVYDERFENSGGSIYVDESNVNITISHWSVSRESDSSLATCSPSDGCKFSDLADKVGLEISEISDWLTVSLPTARVELWDQQRILASNVHFSNPEAVDSYILTEDCPPIFSVPNVIFAAYCYDPSLKNPVAGQEPSPSCFRWDHNIGQLEALGFKVVQFDNSVQTSASLARQNFCSTIRETSQAKELHGLYLVGHGSQVAFGVHGTNTSGVTWGADWGPKWGIYYCADNRHLSIKGKIKYKLGALVIHACNSVNNNSVQLVTGEIEGDQYRSSGFAVYCGFEVVTRAHYEDIASWWNGGKQGTKILHSN